jgi:hypothetical protein
MTKKQVIKAIEHAQEYHLQQMEKVTLLVNGKRVKNPTPLSKDTCEFGYWLYGEASRIKKLLGIQFYKSMDLIHEYWHIQYEKIYNIYYDVEDDGIFNKLLGYKMKLSPQEHQEVQEIYASLQQATDDLSEALIASKRRIIALKDYAFENID